MARVIEPVNFTSAPWYKGIEYIDFRNKFDLVRMHVRYMLARTNRMFKVEGLPNTMPEYIIKEMLQMNGHIFIPTEREELFALCGQFGGEPSPYYRGTEYVVANPALNIEKEYKIDEGVVIRNDHQMIGLLPLCNRYATLLVENELSIINNFVTGRAAFIAAVGTDADKLAVDDFIRKLWAGDLTSVLETRVLDGINVNPGMSATDNRLTTLIEANQFIKASWFNDLGLDANYNMKRESLTANEVEQNSDSLMPLVDDMIDSWREGFNELNERRGLNITVSFNSSWADNDAQIHIDPDEGTPEEPKEETKEGEENVKVD